jgi:hypothetical protein
MGMLLLEVFRSGSFRKIPINTDKHGNPVLVACGKRDYEDDEGCAARAVINFVRNYQGLINDG